MELVCDEIGYVAEAISKKSAEGTAWLFPTAYSKIWGERKNLKVELSKKKAELQDLEDSQPVHTAKKWEHEEYGQATIY